MEIPKNLPHENIPVIPTRGTVIYPAQSIALLVGRPRSVKALEEARRDNGYLLVLAQREELKEREPLPQDLYKIGTLCKVENIQGDAKKGLHVLVMGLARFKVEALAEDQGSIRANGYFLEDVEDMDETTSRVLMRNLKTLAKDILSYVPGETEKLVKLVDSVEDPVTLCHTAAQYLEVGTVKKQEILELDSLKHRILKLLDLLAQQKEELKLQYEVSKKLSRKMGKQQREVLLREQIKAMQEELGEGGEASLNEEYRKKIEKAKMPKDVKKIALEQVQRLETLSSASPEMHVIRNYLDLLCAMPWCKSSPTQFDLEFAKKSLEEDHYGLEEIKKRIVQHLAVLKLKKDKKGSILLFVGPPGVGKTSLGKSIAKALGREFVRASLGGVRDDAEIRGHRRTYIGAMPGRVIEGIKRAGTRNPVFMLDEIDKLARGFTGDPASALLEVLDPEQNSNFNDHYLDVPFDLSNVFFIATANSLETIPLPLLDRMEVILLTGYTIPEKLHIAERHLLPKQLAEHGITGRQLKIPEEVLNHVVTHYTREAGVRDLERKIAAILRAASEKILEKDAKLPITVTVADLDEILGGEKYFIQVAEIKNPPGVVTGLAWTPMGGEILFVESKSMPGSGKLTLTGQLGDVMKESAQIALSLIRSKLSALAKDFHFEKQDIHVHVPAGSIPKDGPSAGVTMLVALASLILGKSVDPKLAMSGEITLRGAVTPVGGIKEKVIAAHRAGIERIVLAKRNERDLRNIPEEVRSQLKFEFVERVEDVLQIALGVELEPIQYKPSATAPDSEVA